MHFRLFLKFHQKAKYCTPLCVVCLQSGPNPTTSVYISTVIVYTVQYTALYRPT